MPVNENIDNENKLLRLTLKTIINQQNNLEIVLLNCYIFNKAVTKIQLLFSIICILSLSF
jgi:hypothetical protein